MKGKAQHVKREPVRERRSRGCGEAQRLRNYRVRSREGEHGAGAKRKGEFQGFRLSRFTQDDEKVTSS
jgi:hypothetical protein